MNLELHTERLYMRPLQLDDLDVAIEIFTDEETVRFVGGETYTPEELEADMPTSIRRCAHGCIGIWCVIDKQTGEKYGSSILLPMPVDKDDTDWDLVVGDDIPDAEIEIGYMLKRSAWGRGIATEAATRLLRFAFENTPLDLVVASIDEENSASEHVLRKIGLQYDGLEWLYAEMAPKFSITRQQWLEQQSSVG